MMLQIVPRGRYAEVSESNGVFSVFCSGLRGRL